MEFVIGGVKSKFCIVKTVWNRGARVYSAPDVFFAACQLFNFWQECNGYLRGAAYQQQGQLEIWEGRLTKGAGGGVRSGLNFRG